jgi:hypothetical protein
LGGAGGARFGRPGPAADPAYSDRAAPFVSGVRFI